MRKTYLGDGVYVEFNRIGNLILTASDGIQDTNTIIMEPGVVDALKTYLKNLKGK